MDDSHYSYYNNYSYYIYDSYETIVCLVKAHLVIYGILVLILVPMGIVGNALVIVAVLLSKKLRTTTNAFVVNLSVADLLTSLGYLADACTTLSIVDDLYVPSQAARKARFLRGIIYAAFTGITVGCSIITLTGISLSRLLLITRPTTTYRSVFTPRKTAVWLTLTWVVPPLIVVAFVFFGLIVGITAMLVTITVALYVPLAIIIINYTLIWKYIRRHNQSMARSFRQRADASPEVNLPLALQSASGSGSDSHQPQSPASAGRPTVGRSQLNHRQIEITKNMLYVTCAFVLCLIPFSVCYVTQDIVAKLYGSVFLFLNSCINPLIYARKHRDFMTVFGCILRRQWDKIPEPSDFLKGVRRS